MIVDITGVVLIPGNLGKDCPGNGTHKETECCCDECDYMLCCLPEHDLAECLNCSDKDCPRNRTMSFLFIICTTFLSFR